MTKIAVVILNYNGKKLLAQFLPSVIENSPGATIVVVDNNSTDDSVDFIKTQFPDVKIIVLDQNYGFCGGYNRGLSQVQSEYYVLLNSDVEVTPTWLKPLEELLDKNPGVAAAQPKILAYRTKTKFEYAGAGGGLIDALGYPFCRGRLFNHAEEDNGQYNDTVPVFWTSGACMMIRSSVFHRFGGFDESFFAHMEEIDLCWKINRTQQKVYYCGASTVYHVGAGTLSYESPRKTFLNFRNNLVLVFKHWDTSEMVYKLPLRFVLDWLAGFNFLVTGRFSNAVSVIKAQWHFISTLSQSRKKRQEIHQEHPSYPRQAIYNGSIVVEFFLKGRRKISINNPK
jgi:GT2 family glycosyltransferase